MIFFNVADVPHIEVIFDHQKAQMSTYFLVRGRLKIFQNDLSFGRCSFSSNDLTLFEKNLFWNLFRTSLFSDWFKLWLFWKYLNFCLTTITCSNRVLMHDMMQIFTNTKVCFTIWLKLPDAIETYSEKKTHSFWQL